MAKGLGLLVFARRKSPGSEKVKITVNPTFDIETGALLAHDGQYEYDGPYMAMKGGTSQAQANINTANADNSQLFSQGQQEQSQILPFLQGEMLNPQGFGTAGTNELLTAGGEAASGATGAATEAANLRASRMGNPSSTASIIDAAARSGAQQQSANALDVNKANLQEKLNQQQAGEQGIGALSSGNIGESLSALGLSNDAVKDYISAYSANSPLHTLTSLMGAAGSAAKGIGEGVAGV
jgi:hypothetical protein